MTHRTCKTDFTATRPHKKSGPDTQSLIRSLVNSLSTGEIVENQTRSTDFCDLLSRDANGQTARFPMHPLMTSPLTPDDGIAIELLAMRAPGHIQDIKQLQIAHDILQAVKAVKGACKDRRTSLPLTFKQTAGESGPLMAQDDREAWITLASSLVMADLRKPSPVPPITSVDIEIEPQGTTLDNDCAEPTVYIPLLLTSDILSPADSDGDTVYTPPLLGILTPSSP